MKPAAVLLLALLLTAGSAYADLINGRSYVSLAVWGRAYGFGVYSQNSGTKFVVTNRNARLVFNLDSADSTLNGLHVRLSFPVAKGGFISQLDADKTLRPLLFPQRPSAKKVRTICLDPGHGGKDTGNRVGRFFPRSEKTYTLALALELRRQLQLAGFNVILTRDSDVYPELPVRPDLANRRGADLFISLHFNSSPSDAAGVQGPETYAITPVGAASSNDAEREGLGAGACAANRYEDKSLLLACLVQRSLVNSLGMTDRSVRRARFEVLRIAQMPAVLIEGGYMSNPTDAHKIFDADWRQKMAAAIVHGILNYRKIADPPTAAPTAARSSAIPHPSRK